MPCAPEPTDWVEVSRGPDESACRERALVLEAVAIEYELVGQEGQCVLRVPASAAAAAAQELAWYDEENRDWPPSEPEPVGVAGGQYGALGYSALLMAVYAAQLRVGGAGWWDAGIGQSAAMRGGQWWRAVTALTLHADAAHLAANLLFGSLFIALLCRQLGTGPAWFAALAAGTFGNLINALLHPAPHRFVGASTAVFGAVGILVVGPRRQAAAGAPSAVGWRTPLLAGAAFLALLGTTGERTDVLAHLAGLVCGMASGLWWRRVAEVTLCRPCQVVLAWAAAAIVVGCWAWALARG